MSRSRRIWWDISWVNLARKVPLTPVEWEWRMQMAGLDVGSCVKMLRED
jgi:hypothetical protein